MQIDYSLYLILDDTICKPDDMPKILQSVVNHGITCVQLRMKHAERETIIAVSHKLISILKPNQIPFILNDYIDIAKIVNADGVHLGQKDESVENARHQLGPDKIIGLSIETISQAKICKDYDVNYFGVGPIYTTTTKSDAAKPIGIDDLTTIMSILSKPVVAIGGINSTNALAVLKTDVAGIAVVSAILSAKEPSVATKNLVDIINNLRAEHAELLSLRSIRCRF